MPAANTDKFRLVAPNTGWQLDASGISDAVVTSFGLVSSTALPTATGVTITVDRVDASGTKTPAKMERIKGVISGTNVVSCVRGTGGTAQAHAGGAIVEIVIDSTLWNDFINGILTFATQAGKLLQSAIDSVRYGADAGGDDTYAVTLDPVPAAYYAGMEVNFKPTTANTGACTLDVNGLGAKTIKKNVSTDLATGDILSGQMVKVLYDGTNFQLVSTIPAAALYAPRGFLTNGKIVPSVASNNLTLAIKTAAGADPSASDPVYVRIGDTVRTITAAISVTANASNNYLNIGGVETATREVDVAVYVEWETSASLVRISFSRLFNVSNLSEFNASATNERGCISNRGATVGTDECEVVGRFSLINSGTASFNWSVPAFTSINLVQKPIYETRLLDSAGTVTGFSAAPSGTITKYRIRGGMLKFYHNEPNSGTSNATTFTVALPMASQLFMDFAGHQTLDAGAGNANQALCEIASGGSVITCYKTDAAAAWTNSGAKRIYDMVCEYPI